MNIIRQGYQPTKECTPRPPKINTGIEKKYGTITIKIKADTTKLERAIDKVKELEALLKALGGKMNNHEKLIKFKYEIENLKDNVFNGNQLAIMYNGQLIALANYQGLEEIIKTLMARLEKEIDSVL